MHFDDSLELKSVKVVLEDIFEVPNFLSCHGLND